MLSADSAALVRGPGSSEAQCRQSSCAEVAERGCTKRRVFVPSRWCRWAIILFSGILCATIEPMVSGTLSSVLDTKGEVIRDYFLNFRHNRADLEVDLASGDVTLLSKEDVDWRVRLVDTGMNTQTGARIRRIAHHIQSDRFFATYGDGVANIDLDELLRFHREQGKQITVTAVRPPSRFGELLSTAPLSAISSKSRRPARDGSTVVFSSSSARRSTPFLTARICRLRRTC